MSSKYAFWLKQGEKAIQLPVNPEKVTFGNRAKNSTVKVDGLGDVTILQAPNCITVSFESEFPAKYYAGCEYLDIPNPIDAFMLIEGMKRSGPVRLVIAGSPIQLLGTIEDFSPTETGGDVGTLSYKFKFKEYRDAKPKQIVVKNDVAILSTSEKRSDPRPVQDTYTVVKNDCLWKIAKLKLGSGSRYPEIAKLNNIKPRYTIYVGDVLKLPKR